MSLPSELGELEALRKKGVIGEGEFVDAKRILIEKAAHSPAASDVPASDTPFPPSRDPAKQINLLIVLAVLVMLLCFAFGFLLFGAAPVRRARVEVYEPSTDRNLPPSATPIDSTPPSNAGVRPPR